MPSGINHLSICVVEYHFTYIQMTTQRCMALSIPYNILYTLLNVYLWPVQTYVSRNNCPEMLFYFFFSHCMLTHTVCIAQNKIRTPSKLQLKQWMNIVQTRRAAIDAIHLTFCYHLCGMRTWDPFPAGRGHEATGIPSPVDNNFSKRVAPRSISSTMSGCPAQ